MTNTTIRERFGLDLKNSATAPRLIKEAVTAGMVKPQDENAAPKMMQYVPFWASIVSTGAFIAGILLGWNAKEWSDKHVTGLKV